MAQASYILLADFGSQVTQLIARRVREAGVYCEMVPYGKAAEFAGKHRPAAVILSGGPASVGEGDAPAAAPELFQLGVPVLGICYGQQAMCTALGGKTERHAAGEYGPAELMLAAASPLWEGIGRQQDAIPVWMSHGDRVEALPQGFASIGTSEGAPFAAIADEARRFYGVQFHPEVTHTPSGAQLIENFVHKIAGCKSDWTMADFRTQSIAAIREQTKEGGEVICALSGGVDSAVAALLVHEAVGERLRCIFVDNGLMRQNEREEVVALFSGHFNIPLDAIDAGERFLSALEGVSDPEEKRKIIGRLFIEIFEEQARGAKFLVQGTLYPDVIESVSPSGAPSQTIKSHHNVGGLPEEMNLELVEPLRSLFKDEVRKLGGLLGLPKAFIRRHPFPGPGLAIRIPGPVTAEKCAILRRADAIWLEELHKAGLYDSIWQAFAALLPVKSVGVMGDARNYSWACALRAVVSVDGMTAEAFSFPAGVLEKAAARIVNEVAEINRVLYDITSKPPASIEWE